MIEFMVYTTWYVCISVLGVIRCRSNPDYEQLPEKNVNRPFDSPGKLFIIVRTYHSYVKYICKSYYIVRVRISSWLG